MVPRVVVLYRFDCISNPYWQSSGIIIFLVQILHSHLRYTDRFLDVFFLLPALILSELHGKQWKKDRVTEKLHRRKMICRYKLRYVHVSLSNLKHFFAFSRYLINSWYNFIVFYFITISAMKFAYIQSKYMQNQVVYYLENEIIGNLEFFRTKKISSFYTKYYGGNLSGDVMSERSKIWKSSELVKSYVWVAVFAQIAKLIDSIYHFAKVEGDLNQSNPYSNVELFRFITTFKHKNRNEYVS